MNCELCKFENPKGSVTGIIIKDNKILVLKRNEELGIKNAKLTFIKTIPGTAYWKDYTFPAIVFFYLVDVSDTNFVLNEENSELRWIPISDIRPEDIAWDTNQQFISWLKLNLTFDLDRIKELVKQLDPDAEVREQVLYQAFLNGHISRVYNGEGKLAGMGWIFIRQTALRKQAVIEDMIVDEVYRGMGFGKTILDQLIKWAKEQGVEVIELTTNPKRVAAHALYEKFGFVIHITDHMLLML